MFNLLLEASSPTDRALLLSVSSPHASSWLSVVPSQELGLHLDPPVHQAAMKWWLDMDTPHGSQCALYPGNYLDPLGHHAIRSLVSMGVMLWRDLCDVLAETCHWTHLGVKVEAGNYHMANHSHSHPADLDKLGYRQVSCLL